MVKRRLRIMTTTTKATTRSLLFAAVGLLIARLKDLGNEVVCVQTRIQRKRLSSCLIALTRMAGR